MPSDVFFRSPHCVRELWTGEPMNDEYRMRTVYGRDEITTELKSDFQLSWLTYAIEQAFSWFLGRGIWKFHIERRRNGDRVELVMKGEVPSKGVGLSMSASATIEGLCNIDFIPDMDIEPFTTEAGFTSINYKDPVMETSVAFLAYGMSDTIAALFLRGVQVVRFRATKDAFDLMADIGMTNEELREFISKERDYSETTTVGDLPWRDL